MYEYATTKKLEHNITVTNDVVFLLTRILFDSLRHTFFENNSVFLLCMCNA